MEELQKDVRDLIELLNAAGVRYLIVGGRAVGFYGHPRLTKDVDFFVEPTPENAERVVDALGRFGLPVTRGLRDDLSHPGTMITFGRPPNRVDIITDITGVRFENAWKRRVEHVRKGLRVAVIGLEHLVRNKRATGRLQDKADAERLLRRKKAVRQRKRRRR